MGIWSLLKTNISLLKTCIKIWVNSPYRISGAGCPAYVYHEGERKVTIGMQATIGSPKGDLAIQAFNIITWNPPHDHETISQQKRKQILERLGEYLIKHHNTYWIIDERILQEMGERRNEEQGIKSEDN